MSQEEVLSLLRDGDRAVRQAAADAFSAGLKQLERVICFTYNTLLADKKLEDRLRKYEYPEQSRHMANELDKETVDLVVGLCKERSDLVARYYRVKGQILGLPELTHVDRYAPLFEAEETIDRSGEDQGRRNGRRARRRRDDPHHLAVHQGPPDPPLPRYHARVLRPRHRAP
jgi:oligoendopeptidase F